MFSFQNLFAPFSNNFNNQPYSQCYRCYSRSSLTNTDKLILPQSTLTILTHMDNITYPMVFQINNNNKPNSPNFRYSHCGVREFTSNEGEVYISKWKMENLDILEGGVVNVINVNLSKASSVVFQPYSSSFTLLSNPKVVLEKALRNFSTLTKSERIVIEYLDNYYYLKVVSLSPNDAVSIIETDVVVEFIPPNDNNNNDSTDIDKSEIKDDNNHNKLTKSQSAYFASLSKGRRISGKPTPVTPPRPQPKENSHIFEVEGDFKYHYQIRNGKKKLLSRTFSS